MRIATARRTGQRWARMVVLPRANEPTHKDTHGSAVRIERALGTRSESQPLYQQLTGTRRRTGPRRS